MSPLAGATVAVRRFLVRRPWVHWLFVAVAALGAAASMLERSDRIDAARASWGTTRTVWVAASDLGPGDPLDVETREVPTALVEAPIPAGVDGLVARHRLGRGEIVHESDVVAPDGPLAMTPDGWLVVPVLESPSSGARIGDRVRAASDGVLLSRDALVVGHHDEVTLVAVPEADAPLIPAAADVGRVTLLLVP